MSIKIPHGIPLHQSQQAADDKVRAVSKMYEEYFLQQMVKAMRSTVNPAEKPTMAENIYRQQLDHQYVKTWGNQGGVGLADIIYNQLEERFMNHAPPPRVMGPIPIRKGVEIKIEKPQQMGIPVVSPKSTQQKDVSLLFKWDDSNTDRQNVSAPLDAEVVQAFRSGDDRQTIKLAHDNGLVSTISYIGSSRDVVPGQKIAAGEILGTLSPAARGLTWQISQNLNSQTNSSTPGQTVTQT